jgi:quaternary ammonium compound-resistance protein SugE
LHWTGRIVASLFEACIPLLIIRSEDYSQPLYLPLLLATVVCSILGLRYAMAAIPLTTAYMVWTSLGILGTALIGVTLLDETLSPIEIGSLLLIAIAVAGLRICSTSQEPAGT